MRVFLGMLLGAALTVATAFVVDTWATGPVTTGGPAAAVEHRTMVNWGVVGNNLSVVRDRAREAWSTLSHKVAG